AIVRERGKENADNVLIRVSVTCSANISLTFRADLGAAYSTAPYTPLFPVFDKVILSAFDGTNVIGAAVECNDYLLSLRELFFEFRADPIGLHAGVCVTRAATFRCINSIQSKSRPFHWLFVLRKYSG